MENNTHIYKDMLEKLKYHKKRLMESFIKNNYYPSNQEIEAALTSINARLALFESSLIKPGSLFNTKEMNHDFEMIYKDIEILYKVLEEILLNEYSQLKMQIESSLLELESKALEFLRRSKEEANATALGTTIMFKTNGWNLTTKDQYTILDLGSYDLIKGSTIACFANINNVTNETVSFKFVSNNNDNNNFLALPYNLANNKSYTIPGDLSVNKFEFELGSSSVINDYIAIDHEMNFNNKYKMLGGKNLMSVTNKRTGITTLVPFPYINDNAFYTAEPCILEFYIVDGNVSEDSILEYSMNMAPEACNFNMEEGFIRLKSDIKHIKIDAGANFTVAFNYEQGQIYSECMDAIISEKDKFIYNGNLSVRSIMLREYVRTETEPYNIYVYINTKENIVTSIESIYIKEVG